MDSVAGEGGDLARERGCSVPKSPPQHVDCVMSRQVEFDKITHLWHLGRAHARQHEKKCGWQNKTNVTQYGGMSAGVVALGCGDGEEEEEQEEGELKPSRTMLQRARSSWLLNDTRDWTGRRASIHSQ